MGAGYSYTYCLPPMRCKLFVFLRVPRLTRPPWRLLFPAKTSEILARRSPLAPGRPSMDHALAGLPDGAGIPPLRSIFSFYEEL